MMLENIKNKELIVKPELSKEAKDLIEKMLIWIPKKWLGYGDKGTE